jgi:hypothetical protein
MVMPPAPLPHPDAAILAAAREHEAVVAALGPLDEAPNEAALVARMFELQDEMERLAARTWAGAVAKARCALASGWCESLPTAAIQDLLRIAAVGSGLSRPRTGRMTGDAPHWLSADV